MIEIAVGHEDTKTRKNMGHKKAQKDIKKLATEGADTLGTSLHGFLWVRQKWKKGGFFGKWLASKWTVNIILQSVYSMSHRVFGGSVVVCQD